MPPGPRFTVRADRHRSAFRDVLSEPGDLPGTIGCRTSWSLDPPLPVRPNHHPGLARHLVSSTCPAVTAPSSGVTAPAAAHRQPDAVVLVLPRPRSAFCPASCSPGWSRARSPPSCPLQRTGVVVRLCRRRARRVRGQARCALPPLGLSPGGSLLLRCRSEASGLSLCRLAFGGGVPVLPLRLGIWCGLTPGAVPSSRRAPVRRRVLLTVLGPDRAAGRGAARPAGALTGLPLSGLSARGTQPVPDARPAMLQLHPPIGTTALIRRDNV